MADRLITMIVKPHMQSSHERITHIGNHLSGWLITIERAIAQIESGAETFYVLDSKTGRRADVYVRKPYGRAPFLQSYMNDDWSNHLLRLPRGIASASSISAASEQEGVPAV